MKAANHLLDVPLPLKKNFCLQDDDGNDATVEGNAVVVVVGAAGSGKSTMMATLVKVTSLL